MHFYPVMAIKTEELKNRIEAKKHELMASLANSKADAAGEAADKRQSAEKKLRELEGYLKDGWDRVTDQISNKLNDWLKS